MARNLPVPRGFNDRELDFLRQRAIDPLLAHHAPDALVLTCGADSLAGDPLSTMEISNGAMWRTVMALVDRAPAVVLGGGGYNPWTAVRYWAGLWGHLAGSAWPATLPPEARELLTGFDCDLVDEEDIEPGWLTCLEDAPNEGAVRDEVRTLVDTVCEE